MSQDNNLLIYVTEYIIGEGNKTASKLTMMGVYKLLFLMNQQLVAKYGIDMKLPYSWYLYGPMVERDGYCTATGKKLQDYFRKDNSAMNLLNPNDAIEIAKEIGETVIGCVQSIFSDFKKKYIINDEWDLDLMVQDAYENYAPYEFQRVYVLNLRKIVMESSVQKIEEVLDKLLVVFPEDDLEDIYTMYLRWDDTFRLALRYGVPNNHINMVKDEFMEFGKVFFAKIRCLKNENLTDADINRCEENFSQKLEAFQFWLPRLREKLLLNLPEISLSPEDASLFNDLLNDLNAVAFNEAVLR